ncbi:Small Multidrug Resistance protein [Dethiosulfovibrio salsuginis]|uniref:Small Multidrug Resistance protein n=1 Tax=Dethiosulfovibrio salsuginis TaxID=561720 RepID=A0A1X7KHC9_9BACT|nr:Small Multidrug Resistance protein [Dethiosulfovibrio salsuginis]
MLLDSLGLGMIVGSALTNAAASSMMKAGFGHRGDLMDHGVLGAVWQIVTNPWAIGGVMLFGISFVFMSAALSRVDLSVAYPLMSGIVYLVVLSVSVLLFGESLGVAKLLGVLAILSGITVLSLGA